ncbi:hypothetical protein MMC12_007542 [Toensbergia leucococca]|nr:hypothetical protein [Toensbergia leucococca]
MATAGTKASLAQELKKAMEDCGVPAIIYQAEPLSTGFTYHDTILTISGVFSLLCCITSTGLIIAHLINFTNPREQRQIIRIIFVPMLFVIYNFFSVWFNRAAGYLEPVSLLYEALALVALFHLYVEYVSPNKTYREQYYDDLERQTRSGKAKHGKGSLRWFHIIWICVFQLPLTRTITFTIGEAMQATQCPLSKTLKNAHVAISVTESVFIIIAITALLVFYRRMRNHLKQHHALSKLVAYKLVVFISLIQNSIFAGLAAGMILKPTRTVSYLDITVATPAFMTCVEMCIFSFIFVWSFTAKPYKVTAGAALPAEHTPGCANIHRLGLREAVFDVLNFWDLIEGSFFMCKAVKHLAQGSKWHVVRKPSQEVESVKSDDPADEERGAGGPFAEGGEKVLGLS